MKTPDQKGLFNTKLSNYQIIQLSHQIFISPIFSKAYKIQVTCMD
jgi:hypothetical protein